MSDWANLKITIKIACQFNSGDYFSLIAFYSLEKQFGAVRKTTNIYIYT